MSLRHDGKRLGLSLAVNNKSIAKIVFFAILSYRLCKNYRIWYSITILSPIIFGLG